MFDRLATTFASLGTVKFGKMDAASNEIEGLEVRGYPTLLFYLAQDKAQPIKYAGTKDFEGIKEWISSNTAYPLHISLLKQKPQHIFWPRYAVPILCNSLI